MTYENMFASGTIAAMTLALPRMSWPWIWPRRELRSPMTDPVYSSGVTTSTFMIGSSRTGPPFCRASRKAARAQISNAIDDEIDVVRVAVDQA